MAIYAHEDRFTQHRYKADQAFLVGANKSPVGAYLDINGIVDICVANGVEAVHPGYGFLSENEEFARKVRQQKQKQRICTQLTTFCSSLRSSPSLALHRHSIITAARSSPQLEKNGVTFIGPTADNLKQFGDKTAAREVRRQARHCTVSLLTTS